MRKHVWLAAAACLLGARAATAQSLPAAPASVPGVAVDSSGTTPKPAPAQQTGLQTREARFRYAHIECKDGAASESGSSTSCKTRTTWMGHAGALCSGHGGVIVLRTREECR